MTNYHTRSTSRARQKQQQQAQPELDLKPEPNPTHYYHNTTDHLQHYEGITPIGQRGGGGGTPGAPASIISEIQEAVVGNEDINDNHSEISPSIFGTAPTGQVGKSKPRAIVRIERDYSARGASFGRVQFWDGWVEELDGRISPLQLQDTLNDFNLILASAYDPYLSILDNTLAILSLYLSPWIIESHYKKQMKLFKETLDQYNRLIYNPVGLNILHPRKVAFLFLEIEYY